MPDSSPANNHNKRVVGTRNTVRDNVPKILGFLAIATAIVVVYMLK